CEDSDVAAGDHEGVEGAGGAIVFCPHEIGFGGGSDQDRLHHAIRVGILFVELVEPVERGGADGEDQAGNAVSTAAREDVNRRCITGGVPVDLLTGKEVHV